MNDCVLRDQRNAILEKNGLRIERRERKGMCDIRKDKINPMNIQRAKRETQRSFKIPKKKVGKRETSAIN